MWSFDQAKLALASIQKQPYQNEAIDIGNNKNISKNCHIESTTFWIHSDKSYPKKD
jgi:hypothetical protein